MKMKSILKESSLSRVWSHNEKHHCAALTTFRTGADCGKGEKYSKSDNMKRNKSLLAKLQSKGYGVTTLKGKYPEGGKSQMEISFFVVNLQDSDDFFKQIAKLGTEFEQDSVLLIPKGAISGESKAYLIGTNKCENNWLGYGKKEMFKGGKLGKTSPIYTSYVNGRPFIFEEVDMENTLPGNGMGRWAMNIMANKHWTELED